MNGISALLRRDTGEMIPFYHVKMQGEGGHCKPGRGLSPALEHVGTLVLDFQSPEL